MRTLILVLTLLASAAHAMAVAEPGVSPGSEGQGMENASSVSSPLQPEMATEELFAIPDIHPPYVAPGCQLGGCQEETCEAEGTPQPDVACPAMYAYTCYRTTPSRCEKQPNGTCGWTMTPDLHKCLERKK